MSSEAWDCPACTLRNEGSRSICEACEGPKPQAPRRKLEVSAKKAVGGAAASVLELDGLDDASTVADLAAAIAAREGVDAAQITVVCKGAPLKVAEKLVDKEADGKIAVVFIVRKAAPAPAPAATEASSVTSSSSPTSTPASAPAPAAAAPGAAAQTPACQMFGKRVVYLLRHGQCCHEGEADSLKELTQAGHKQAESSAQYLKELFEAGKLPMQRALLHSTSRRATETAAKIPQTLPGIEVWNADLLRETDPTSNPLRAEEVFTRLFVAPAAGSPADTLIVVAHNNIILYLLMRVAGVPIDRAAQAWHLFSLRHASITRVDVSANGEKQIACIGGAGHISDAHMTWSNVTGADMSAWKGGEPERRKMSGRMMVLVRGQATDVVGDVGSRQVKAVASHIKSLGTYMVSGHVTVICTRGGQVTANAVAKKFHTVPQVFPDSIAEQPEAAFLEFFTAATEHKRDTVCMVAEDGPLLYCLLRALHLGPEEAMLSIGAYNIGHASVSLVNIRQDGKTKVVTVGDTGHLALDCT
eukprot:TRINITY_DN32286_c0_g1_i1.p1 TRINITY_DN32286_c0_g1~~TRINITY_DN32286_c0_g1_i1.p1  ORF type:complete len:529 (-),score=135.25 TRINITY_DN32286_c0_g1_i1:98-1684(-)